MKRRDINFAIFIVISKCIANYNIVVPYLSVLLYALLLESSYPLLLFMLLPAALLVLPLLLTLSL